MDWLQAFFEKVWRGLKNTTLAWIKGLWLLFWHPILGPQLLQRRAGSNGLSPGFFLFLTAAGVILQFYSFGSAEKILIELVQAGKPGSALFAQLSVTFFFCAVLMLLIYGLVIISEGLKNIFSKAYRDQISGISIRALERRRLPIVEVESDRGWIKRRYSALPFALSGSFIWIALIGVAATTELAQKLNHFIFYVTHNYDYVVIPFHHADNVFVLGDEGITVGFLLAFLMISPILLISYAAPARLLLFPGSLSKKISAWRWPFLYLATFVVFATFLTAIFSTLRFKEFIEDRVSPSSEISSLGCDFSDLDNPVVQFSIDNSESDDLMFGSRDFSIYIWLEREGIEVPIKIVHSSLGTPSSLITIRSGEQATISAIPIHPDLQYVADFAEQSSIDYHCTLDLEKGYRNGTTIADTFGPWFLSPTRGRVLLPLAKND